MKITNEITNEIINEIVNNLYQIKKNQIFKKLTLKNKLSFYLTFHFFNCYKMTWQFIPNTNDKYEMSTDK